MIKDIDTMDILYIFVCYSITFKRKRTNSYSLIIQNDIFRWIYTCKNGIRIKYICIWIGCCDRYSVFAFPFLFRRNNIVWLSIAEQGSTFIYNSFPLLNIFFVTSNDLWYDLRYRHFSSISMLIFTEKLKFKHSQPADSNATRLRFPSNDRCTIH